MNPTTPCAPVRVTKKKKKVSELAYRHTRLDFDASGCGRQRLWTPVITRSSHSAKAGGFCLCGLSRSGLGCAVRRCDCEFVGGSAPSTLGVAVARVGRVGNAVGRAASVSSTSIEVRGAARSRFCVRPPPHASVARRRLAHALRRRRARSLLPHFCWHPFFAFISACGWSRS